MLAAACGLGRLALAGGAHIYVIVLPGQVRNEAATIINPSLVRSFYADRYDRCAKPQSLLLNSLTHRTSKRGSWPRPCSWPAGQAADRNDQSQLRSRAVGELGGEAGGAEGIAAVGPAGDSGQGVARIANIYWRAGSPTISHAKIARFRCRKGRAIS